MKIAIPTESRPPLESSTWRILAPYLLNIHGLSPDEACGMIRERLNNCRASTSIRTIEQRVLFKEFLPIGCELLKLENEGLYYIPHDMRVFA